MGKKKQKKKKEKVVYYDDNSTIVDMSNVTGVGRRKPDSSRNASQQQRPKSTFKDKWKTYWGAVRMMLLPCCIALFLILVVYIIIINVT